MNGSMAMHSLPIDALSDGCAFELPRISTATKSRLNLMSMTEYYEKWGYDVSFAHSGFTGFHKTDPTTGKVDRIPFFHNPRKHCWTMLTILSSSVDSAQKAGKLVESLYTALFL
eukprot:SAG31_NODE_3105_length_4668_cov_1.437733_6_plen_114_part_00